MPGAKSTASSKRTRRMMESIDVNEMAHRNEGVAQQHGHLARTRTHYVTHESHGSHSHAHSGSGSGGGVGVAKQELFSGRVQVNWPHRRKSKLFGSRDEFTDTLLTVFETGITLTEEASRGLRDHESGCNMVTCEWAQIKSLSTEKQDVRLKLHDGMSWKVRCSSSHRAGVLLQSLSGFLKKYTQ